MGVGGYWARGEGIEQERKRKRKRTMNNSVVIAVRERDGKNKHKIKICTLIRKVKNTSYQNLRRQTKSYLDELHCSVWASITTYHRQGGFTTDICFSQFWSWGPRSRSWPVEFLVRPLFLIL